MWHTEKGNKVWLEFSQFLTSAAWKRGHEAQKYHRHTPSHCIWLRCTFAPLCIADFLSTFGSHSGDSSKLTPSKQKKSWRAITDLIGFHFNHVSGKKTCRHSEENGAKTQSMYLQHCKEGLCLCICIDVSFTLFASTSVRVFCSVLLQACVALHISMHEIPRHIHKCQTIPEERREKGFSWCSFKQHRKREKTEESKHRTGGNHSFSHAVPFSENEHHKLSTLSLLQRKNIQYDDGDQKLRKQDIQTRSCVTV